METDLTNLVLYGVAACAGWIVGYARADRRRKRLDALIQPMKDRLSKCESELEKARSVRDDLSETLHITVGKQREAEMQVQALQRASAEQSERKRKLDEQEANIPRLVEEKKRKLDEREANIRRLVEEKKQAFPWLAQMIADAYEQVGQKLASDLLARARAAPTAAQKVRIMGEELRTVKREERLHRYHIEYLTGCFPWLSEVMEDDAPDPIVETDLAQSQLNVDESRQWLNAEEWSRLPEAERCQLSLDRYNQTRMNRWKVGREYERYVGYLYETAGFTVEFHGAVKGFDDLGRDLIAKRGSEVHIVQCKNWATRRVIHDKHISHLFGTAVEYYLDNNQMQLFSDIRTIVEQAKPILYTTTNLSDKAKNFAKVLSVKVEYKNFPSLGSWPQIKCNINAKSGEWIFHLPFDQQYDRVSIGQVEGERYVATVHEAMNLGFRRAKRWLPDQAS